MNRIGIFTIVLLASLLACSDTQRPLLEYDDDSVTIMTFNVENLFDNIDDPGKDDKAYLPISEKQYDSHIAACNEIEVEGWRDECLNLDWNDKTIEHKLSMLANSIRQIGNGRGPDIIAVQEVENVTILDRLRSEFLADLDYQPAILVEGTDLRGIDVGFLTRLPLASAPTLHNLTFDDYPDRQGDTRGVLEATFELPNGQLLTGFAVHFPAPFHPTPMREIAYRHLNALRDALPDDRHVFTAGDFNTTGTEDQQTGMLERFARTHWTVAHEFGCGDCTGSHYYARDDSWSFLDMILWSPACCGNATWEIRADSVRIANRFGAQTQPDGSPARYLAARRTGVSDHWPLVMTIEPTEKQ